MLYPTKAKIKGSSGHKHERTLQFFYIFPAIYSTYTSSARKKSSRIFLTRACADYSNTIFPGKYVYIYNSVARRKAAMVALLARDGSNRLWAYLA
uniref:Uncharacterized protein n=1 Tax=Siphoviridae sp. ctKcB20 TaxID=2827568 RepID=A0A8S5LLJ9_9CAUD|nr:MAG TPA: hypothetical protein [Siphoviridae sp. ctKcB20]